MNFIGGCWFLELMQTSTFFCLIGAAFEFFILLDAPLYRILMWSNGASLDRNKNTDAVAVEVIKKNINTHNNYLRGIL